MRYPKYPSLLNAMHANGLESISAHEKSGMIDLILSGGPWTGNDRQAILDYCQTDVDALARLLPAMVPRIDTGCALLRGRYMVAVARIEHAGTPVDTGTLEQLRGGWDRMKTELIARVDGDYVVFDGTTFKTNLFVDYLARKGIAWPRHPTGRLDLQDTTFRDRARAHPKLEDLGNLKVSLSKLRLNDLAVGADGRNRCMLSPLGTRTGRNTPSNSRFVFGPSAWLRSLIKLPPGHGLAYIDYSSQEIGIAAALSGDRALINAYHSGDPYLTFAKQVGAAPADATKASH